ncbi:MAG: hypothetical protein R6V44_13410 [Paracoccaceae bacterium]
MLKILIWIVYAAAAAAIADLLVRRWADRGECALHKALLLQDSCRGRCPPGQRCVAFQTRRHWLFGRQAVACGCIEARAGGTPVEPPDFAELPKRLGGPTGPKAPETEPEREDV